MGRATLPRFEKRIRRIWFNSPVETRTARSDQGGIAEWKVSSGQSYPVVTTLDDNASRVSDIIKNRTKRQIDDDLAERRKILLVYVNKAKDGVAKAVVVTGSSESASHPRVRRWDASTPRADQEHASERGRSESEHGWRHLAEFPGTAQRRAARAPRRGQAVERTPVPVALVLGRRRALAALLPHPSYTFWNSSIRSWRHSFFCPWWGSNKYLYGSNKYLRPPL